MCVRRVRRLGQAEESRSKEEGEGAIAPVTAPVISAVIAPVTALRSARP